MLKKLWIGLVVMVVLALDWAALHDILAGEPDTWMEWGFLAASLLLFAFYFLRKRRGTDTHPDS